MKLLLFRLLDGEISLSSAASFKLIKITALNAVRAGIRQKMNLMRGNSLVSIYKASAAECMHEDIVSMALSLRLLSNKEKALLNCQTSLLSLIDHLSVGKCFSANDSLFMLRGIAAVPTTSSVCSSVMNRLVSHVCFDEYQKTIRMGDIGWILKLISAFDSKQLASAFTDKLIHDIKNGIDPDWWDDRQFKLMLARLRDFSMSKRVFRTEIVECILQMLRATDLSKIKHIGELEICDLLYICGSLDFHNPSVREIIESTVLPLLRKSTGFNQGLRSIYKSSYILRGATARYATTQYLARELLSKWRVIPAEQLQLSLLKDQNLQMLSSVLLSLKTHDVITPQTRTLLLFFTSLLEIACGNSRSRLRGVTGRQLAQLMMGVSKLPAEDSDVQRLLCLLSEMLNNIGLCAHDHHLGSISSWDVSSIVFGLKNKSSSINDVRKLIRSIVIVLRQPSIDYSRMTITAVDICTMLAGLNKLRAEHVEVVELLNLIAPFISACTDRESLDGKMIGNSFYGLQNILVGAKDVHKVIPFVEAVCSYFRDTTVPMTGSDISGLMKGCGGIGYRLLCQDSFEHILLLVRKMLQSTVATFDSHEFSQCILSFKSLNYGTQWPKENMGKIDPILLGLADKVPLLPLSSSDYARVVIGISGLDLIHPTPATAQLVEKIFPTLQTCMEPFAADQFIKFMRYRRKTSNVSEEKIPLHEKLMELMLLRAARYGLLPPQKVKSVYSIPTVIEQLHRLPRTAALTYTISELQKLLPVIQRRKE